jgi:hypothetical protein
VPGIGVWLLGGIVNRRELVSDYLDRNWVVFSYEGQFTPGKAWQHSMVDVNTLDIVAASSTPVAMLLGKVSGVVAIDIDGRNGGDAKKFLEHYGLGPRSTRVHQSASPGSYHMLFNFPEDMQHLQKTKGERTGVSALSGVDMLADGSHILMPPTVRVGHPEKPDGEYKVLVDVPVADMPEALKVDWIAATTRQTPEGKAVGMIDPRDYDQVLALHKKNIEIAANAVEGTRDDTCMGRLGSSIRIALAMPDVVLSIDKVREDFEEGVPYAIRDLDGKITRAVEWAEQHAWKELTMPEGTLPDGVPAEKAAEYFQELDKLRVREAAKKAFRLEVLEKETAVLDIGEVENGSVFLTTPTVNPAWVVQGLIPFSGTTMLTGKFKSGKSTLMINLIQALTTGGMFLDRFNVPKPMNVAYVDMELGRDLAKRWIKDMPAMDPDRLEYLDRKGRGYTLNMRSETLRSKWARLMLEREVDVLIVDPLSPIMSALNVDENSAEVVRPLLDSFDSLAVEANLKAIVVSHHTGHQDASRARGSTAFMDWASSFMSVIRQGEEYDSPRIFRASGRDVAVDTTELLFDRPSRMLRLAGAVSLVDDGDVPW